MPKTFEKAWTPKTKCCTSRPKCGRCPLVMLCEGTLPEGYTVKKRRLVDPKGKPAKKQKVAKAVKKSRKRRLPVAA